MKFRIPFITIFIIVFIGAACGKPVVPDSTTTFRSGFNLILVVEGELLLKRDGWTDFHPTTFGTFLYAGDQLRPSAGSRVVVLCDNLTPWTVPAGAPSGLNNGCPKSTEPSLVRGESMIGSTRGKVDPSIPYIISPRSTKLLSSTPTLRWNAVPGTASYTVYISGVDWQSMVSTTEIIYPGVPPLQLGETYLLIVEADNGRSSKDEGTPGLGFSLLSEEENVRVRTASSIIDSMNLSYEARSFALAQLYVSHGLYAEAIELLQETANAGSQASNIYRSLGDLYWQIGLVRLAEDRYLSAVVLAGASGDIEALAATQTGLGEVYKELDNKAEAVHRLQQAQAGYQTLGDVQHMSEINNLLADLTP